MCSFKKKQKKYNIGPCCINFHVIDGLVLVVFFISLKKLQ